MGDNWVSRIIVNAVSAPVANAVQTGGSMVGGAVGAVGNGINGVGRSIEGSIRYYGDGVKDYGNSIQDWTKSGGARVPTANNPLGLSGTPVQGKLAFTGGKSKSAPAQKAIKPPVQQGRLPAPAAKKTATPVKASTGSAASKPKSAANGTKAVSNPSTKPSSKKVPVSAESRPSKTPRATAPKGAYGADSMAARNPLGI